MMMKTLILILGMFLFPIGLIAQDTETTSTVEADTTEVEEQEESQAQSSGAGVEKIQVTGSHIKRIDVEGPSPVLTLDRDYLDRTGYNNVGDVLRDTTVASFGGQRETALQGGAYTGASTTSLRGFGSDRILVMLDGKRLPTLGGTSTVDLSLVPMAAVERIEILKDGASAIYGSDALGGVINIITKKSYDGASIEIGSFVPDSPGGMRNDVKASYGKTWNGGEFLGVLQYRNNQETWSRDYDYARPRPEHFSTFSSPGTWVDPNNGVQAGSAADPCPPERVNPDGYCTFDYSPYSQITPAIEQYSSLVAAKFDINESLSTYVRGIYTRRKVDNQLAPPPDRFNDASATGGLDTQIDQATATGWGLPATGDLNDVRYRLVEEGGPRIGEVKTDSYALQTGVEGYFLDSWEWEFSGTHGASLTTNEGKSGYYNKQILYNTAVNNPAAFNPFAAPGTKADASFAAYRPLDEIDSTMSTVNMVATGELFDMPAGPMALAVGVSNAWQTYEQTTDAITGAGAQWGGGASAVGRGRRDFQSAYTELSIPPMRGMEVQVAGRFDNYSDFGSTFNPKFGFRYKPAKQFMIRGSWGTGYRAPSLEDLYQTQTTSYPFGEDPIGNPGVTTQYETLVGGNQQLKEETTTSYNVGIVMQLLEQLSFVMDYWSVSQNNVVSSGTLRNIFRAEQEFGVGYLQGLGLDVIRDPNTNQIVRVIAPNVNLAKKEVSGIDFQLGYTLPVFGSYKFRAGVNHSIILELLLEPFPGLGTENQVGFSGNPYWRNNVTVGLGNQTWDYSLVARTIGEQNKSAQAPVPGTNGKTRNHTELDLRVQYSAPWNGILSAQIQNIFDTDRPETQEYLSNGYLNTNLYSPFGRTFGLTYRQDF